MAIKPHVNVGSEPAHIENIVALSTDENVPQFSDEALALQFAAEHQDHLRFTPEWNFWHEWTGTHWRRDKKLRAFSSARATCRAAASRANKGASAIASAKKVAAVLTLARADRRLVASSDQWDKDPFLLGTPDGTVDLRTGKLRASKPADYITQITAAAPRGKCPLWLSTLERITADDPELAAYLKRLAGYSLTGLTREEIVTFFHGDGGNGKGTFIETIAGALGDYATTVAMSTLLVTKHSEHPTEIAKLRGARLAVASETSEGARWNAARIKLLTGGDRLTGRFMRCDYFDFTATHKLIVSGNKRPALGNVDAAITRRLHLVPFEVTIRNPDKGLKERLVSEWPGILAWMIEGCLEWQEIGLNPPSGVIEATRTYLRDQDDMQLWLDECCDLTDSQSVTLARDLFDNWRRWCERTNAWAGATKQFSQRLTQRGFASHKSNGVLAFHEIKIAAPAYKPPPGGGRADYDDRF